MRALLVATVTATLAVGGGENDKDRLKQSLMDADRAFAKATAERRIDGWMECFAEDAVRVTPIGGKAYFGTKSIRQLDSQLFSDPALKLVWAPTQAGAYGDGKLGFTTGKGRILRAKQGAEDELVEEVAYVTIWRKDDGRWKVILDTGARAEKEEEK